MRKLIGLFFIFAAAAYAQPPKVVNDAFETYREGGPQKMLEALLKKSPLENDKSVMSQAATIMQLESYCGKFQDQELVGEFFLGQRVKRLYYVNYHQFCPIYVSITTYDGEKGEVVTHFNFNASAEAVIPMDVLRNKSSIKSVTNSL